MNEGIHYVTSCQVLNPLTQKEILQWLLLMKSENWRKARTLKDRGMNEAVTQSSLIVPFIRILGYDVSDPDEVWAEYTADVPKKRSD